MQVFSVTLVAVLVLLASAVPGYLLMKKKILSEACIPGFSKILVYVCQPCLAVYTFKSAEYSAQRLAEVGVFALLSAFVPSLVLLLAYLVFRNKGKEQVVYRIITIACAFGNCAFFGIPIIEAVFAVEVAREVILYTTVYSLMMNITGWTVGSAIISGDKRYISLYKIAVNPATLGTAVALFLFVLEIPIQKDLFSMISSAAKMATPLSMIVMGMRLATIRLSSLFTDVRKYLAVAVKQIAMPLVAFALLLVLPIDPTTKSVFFVISACPVASVVLSYSEMVGEGQKDAANILLLGTLLSVITLPCVSLLLPLLN
jgi:predicted permease